MILFDFHSLMAVASDSIANEMAEKLSNEFFYQFWNFVIEVVVEMKTINYNEISLKSCCACGLKKPT